MFTLLWPTADLRLVLSALLSHRAYLKQDVETCFCEQFRLRKRREQLRSRLDNIDIDEDRWLQQYPMYIQVEEERLVRLRTDQQRLALLVKTIRRRLA